MVIKIGLFAWLFGFGCGFGILDGRVFVLFQKRYQSFVGALANLKGLFFGSLFHPLSPIIYYPCGLYRRILINACIGLVFAVCKIFERIYPVPCAGVQKSLIKRLCKYLLRFLIFSVFPNAYKHRVLFFLVHFEEFLKGAIYPLSD